jgi:hypothetical protein
MASPTERSEVGRQPKPEFKCSPILPNTIYERKRKDALSGIDEADKGRPFDMP